MLGASRVHGIRSDMLNAEDWNFIVDGSLRMAPSADSCLLAKHQKYAASQCLDRLESGKHQACSSTGPPSCCARADGCSKHHALDLGQARSLFPEAWSCPDERERVQCVRLYRQAVDLTAIPGETFANPAVTSTTRMSSADEVLPVLCDRAPPALEFLARTTSSLVGDTSLSVYFNDGYLLAPNLSLTSSFQFFKFELPEDADVWNVVFGWSAGQHKAHAETSQHEGAVVLLDTRYGVRVDGQDLLCQAMDVDRSDVAWRRRGASASSRHQGIRRGMLGMVPFSGRMTIEQGVEFVAWGASGREQVDVFVNGFEVPCDRSCQLGAGQQQSLLLRYSMVPMSASIHSVVIHISFASGHSDDEPAVMIDPSFGIMVAGKDCLDTAVLADRTGKRNPFRWTWDSPEHQALLRGHWSWQGLYILLPRQHLPRKRPGRPVSLN